MVAVEQKRIRRIGSLAATLLASFLALSARADVLIEHVNVISMLPDQAAQADMNVLIRNGRIESITPAAANRPVASGTTRIDARGQWLMPGLADMHVHLESDRLFRLYTG